jgi:glycosyltransferase involved in cell wall biosynthesis
VTRIAVVTEIPAPFRIPLFNELAAHTPVRVLFLSERDPKRPYPVYAEEFGFDSTVLPGWSFVRGGRWVMVSRRAVRELRRFRPDAVVLGGWNQPAFWQALAYAKARRRVAVAWVESTARDERPGSALYERAKRVFLRASDGFLVPGTASRDYLQSLGVRPDRIAIAPNAVDPAIFGRRETGTARDELRTRLGIEGYCVLTVARLDPEKNVDGLIRAIARLEPGVELVVAGEGPRSAALHRLADAIAPGRVRFLGFVPREELVRWYAAADVFVLASTSEQWGMVLNEAAAAGLPLVATEAAGAAWDLIEDGVNGYRLPVGDEDTLVHTLERLRDDEALREAAGERSATIAAGHTPQAWAAAVQAFVASLRA